MYCRLSESNPGVGLFWSGLWDYFRIARIPLPFRSLIE